jgi:hypothetical protein
MLPRTKRFLRVFFEGVNDESCQPQAGKKLVETGHATGHYPPMPSRIGLFLTGNARVPFFFRQSYEN